MGVISYVQRLTLEFNCAAQAATSKGHIAFLAIHQCSEQLTPAPSQ